MLLTIRLVRCSCPSAPAAAHWIGRRWKSGKSKQPKNAAGLFLPETPARTRFAPSPTGYLHLGSLRTALFNYLLAKKTGGQFLLRIEDTDSKRTIPNAEAEIYKDLQWAGLQWDEGPDIGGPYGPYKQSDRTTEYQKHAQQLLDGGHAYRCFCSVEKLDLMAQGRAHLGLPTYDRTCAGIAKEESDDRAAKGEDHVVRLLSPDVYPQYNDMVYGLVGGSKDPPKMQGFNYGEKINEDPILLKTDKTPTYHLANVVDDHLMKITHVIRGTEWMTSTPKHLALYQAFDWEPPQFAHVGLLMSVNGKKLSKRDLEENGIGMYREASDILPDAMVNFVALLGWSHKEKKDVMNMEKLLKAFEMRFTKGNAIVDKQKLSFLNRTHCAWVIKEGGPGLRVIVDKILNYVEEHFPDTPLSPEISLRDYVQTLVEADADNFADSKTFIERNRHFFTEPVTMPFDESRCSFKLMTGTFHVPLGAIKDAAQILPDKIRQPRANVKVKGKWEHSFINIMIGKAVDDLRKHIHGPMDISHRMFKEVGVYEQVGKSLNIILHYYLRHKLLNGQPGPSMSRTMEILGSETCDRRLHAEDAELPRIRISSGPTSSIANQSETPTRLGDET